MSFPWASILVAHRCGAQNMPEPPGMSGVRDVPGAVHRRDFTSRCCGPEICVWKGHSRGLASKSVNTVGAPSFWVHLRDVTSPHGTRHDQRIRVVRARVHVCRLRDSCEVTGKCLCSTVFGL